MARPRKTFNWDVVEALATIRSSELYIARYLLKKEGKIPDKKSVDSYVKLIERRIRERWDLSFVEFREQKQDSWKVELTELQRKTARSGNVVMQIFLGKQDLGQSDKVEQKVHQEADINTTINAASIINAQCELKLPGSDPSTT